MVRMFAGRVGTETLGFSSCIFCSFVCRVEVLMVFSD